MIPAMNGAKGAKSAAEVEREQEAMLAKKYGGVIKRKQPLMPKDKMFFDSADWALAKEKGKTAHKPIIAAAAAEAGAPAGEAAADREAKPAERKA